MRFADQAQYRAIFDNAFEAIVVIDVEGVIQSANAATERLFGYAPRALVGRNVSLLMPEPDASRHDAHLADYARTGVGAIIGIGREIEGKRSDDTVFSLEISVAEWRHGGETFFTGIMRDITRRKEAEAALANREAHLANLYAQTGAGLAETDAAGRFVSVNDRYCEIAGRSREALMGMRLDDIVHPDDRRPAPSEPGRAGPDDAPVSIEQRYVRGNGLIVWVTKTASSIKVGNEEPLALVVAIDVTERKLAETALRESESRLLHLQNEFAHLARINDLGEMAAAIAHEINQPLTAIANFLNAGAMAVAGESVADALLAARDAMEHAADQGLRAGNIVRSLRSFASKSGGHRQVTSADGLVDSATALALIDIRDTGIRLEQRRAGTDAMVEADPAQIQQVLVNLLCNAVEALAANPAGAERRLSIVTRDLAREGIVEFCVSDSGPGIADEIRDRLFQPFVTSKAQGMGMGLSLCRRIVEAHGGTIEADRGGGVGATFRIRLPRHNQGVPVANNVFQ